MTTQAIPSSIRSPFPILLAAAALFAASLAPRAVRGQTPETVINDPCEICTPRSLEVANFDGGAKDLVIGENVNNVISFYSGTGSGSGTDRVEPRTEVGPAVTNPRALTSGELTGDSHRDLVVADFGANEVFLIPGHGDGTFGAKTTLGTPSGPVDLVVADFDGTNGPDVAAAAEAGDAVTVYFNDGSGGVSSTSTLTSTAAGVKSIDAADLGGDGDTDLVAAASDDDELLVFENDGGGSFTANTVSSSFVAPQHVALASANPDTDSDLDLLAYSENETGDPNLAWFEGNGDGTFSSTANAVTTTSDSFFELLTDDYTGDGNADLVIVGTNSKVFENNGTGFDGGTNIDGINGASNTDGAAVTVDFTGDSNRDIVAVTAGFDYAALRAGEGTGTFTSEILVSPPDVQIQESDDLLGTGDIDGDNDPDVVMGYVTQFVWFSNDGTGTFSPAQTVTTAFPSEGIVRDIDDNGVADIFTSGFGVYRYESDGAGGFTETEISTTLTHALAVADLNGDDLYDVAVSHGLAPIEIAVGLNQGDGTFSFSTVTDQDSDVSDLIVADITDDGNLDLVFSRSTDDEVAYHAGDGTGSFGSKEVAATPSGPDRVLARDLNDDGHPDLVSNESGAGPQVYLYDPGSGSFGSGTGYSGEGSAIALADVNGDGAPDLLQGTDWRANDGSGSFGSATSYASVPGVGAVAAAAIDGDSDLDPITASVPLDKVSWFENQGSVLPVELASFDGTQTGEDAVRLTWTTASETDNASFRIQKKVVTAPRRDASTSSSEATAAGWESIGRVDGAGTTDQPQSYQFTAKDLAPGTHQFRLKQVDLDGTTRQHDPVTVDLEMQQPVRLTAPAPHPVQDRASLSFAVKEAQETTVTLYNLLGQEVATLYRGVPTAGEAQSLPLNASSLASGTYVVRLQAGSRTEIRRVTVVH